MEPREELDLMRKKIRQLIVDPATVDVAFLSMCRGKYPDEYFLAFYEAARSMCPPAQLGRD